MRRGFTLVELMLVVAIVGILAALAVYGVRTYISHAKTAEARNSLGQIGKDATTAYAREGMEGAVLSIGTTAGASNRLCTSASAPVPGTLAVIAGRKFQSAPEDWNVDAATPHKGFACLHFSMSDPQYYMYGYSAVTSNSGKSGDTFTAIAHGDLDGDTDRSTFTLKGEVQAGSSGGHELTLAANIDETNPEE
jgi:type IV pilus assembly protein PilA